MINSVRGRKKRRGAEIKRETGNSSGDGESGERKYRCQRGATGLMALLKKRGKWKHLSSILVPHRRRNTAFFLFRIILVKKAVKQQEVVNS